MEPRQIRVDVVEEGGQGKFNLWFGAPSLSFRRAVKISGSRSIDLVVHTGPSSYFGWSPAYPLIFDWPALPRTKQSLTREFTDDDGQNIAETLRFSSPSRFEIVMTSRRTIDAGYVETRRSRQTWTVDSPWWSEASIQTEALIDGKRSSEINIQGRLLP